VDRAVVVVTAVEIVKAMHVMGFVGDIINMSQRLWTKNRTKPRQWQLFLLQLAVVNLKA